MSGGLIAAAEPGSLVEAAESALAAKPDRRTVVVEHGQKLYVAKRLAEKPRRLIQTLFMRWMVKRITGRPLPMRTLALSEAACSMDYEAERLQSLARLGARVPRIAHRSRDYFLLEHSGTVAADLLEHWQQEEWRRELCRLAELGAFHAAGLWHGGAQIKNITLRDGVSTRIDFEENFGEFLPLPVSQATDLVLFLNSISLAGPIDEEESRTLLPMLLDRYFAANPDWDNAIRDVLARALPLFKGLARLGAPLKKRSKKGLRRIEILVAVLDGFLKRNAAAGHGRST